MPSVCFSFNLNKITKQNERNKVQNLKRVPPPILLPRSRSLLSHRNRSSAAILMAYGGCAVVICDGLTCSNTEEVR
jgi:hypothetical protein